MTVSGMDAWVTSAVEDKHVEKALLLAGSLRRVCTSKKLAVLTTCAVDPKLREKLAETFDLVLLLEQECPNGLNLEDYAKVGGFSLVVFNKCVYLSPSTVVLENCDNMFEKYGKFAAWGNEQGVDSSIYLFTPSLQYSKALKKIVHSVGSKSRKGSGGGGGTMKYDGSKTGCFAKCFNLWIQNHFPKWERLGEEYNAQLSLDNGSSKSLSSKVTIANFVGTHPLDMAQDEINMKLKEWGHIEKGAVRLCLKIKMEDANAKTKFHPDVFPQTDVYKSEPIAIVGMSFRLPGGNSVDEFWDLLSNGREAIHLVPSSRWTPERSYLPCQNRNVEAGFLSVPVDEFDSKFFGISGIEAEYLDPQQRLLHEVAWEALEDALIDPLSLHGTQTGVFVGSWLNDYKDMMSRTTDPDFFRAYMGNSIAAGAARLSHFFGTTGPSIGTESGCSSAIVAVDMACKSLRNRDSNLALACGVNLILHPFDHKFLDYVLAPNGRCKTFDADADGFGRAEACAVLLMKRLSDATRDGDKIWGLIRGSAVVQEGVSKSLGTPTVHCESMAMELALKDAHVNPVDVSYVETHGTGTPVGDPLEIAAITKAYSKGRSKPLVIGSVKTNVGHTESASGITGIIKVLLSMRNETIPKHLNLETMNPAINLDVIPAQIPLEAMPWPKLEDKPRIAGVSSFGISGTDGHVIIQEPPAFFTHSFNKNELEDRPLHVLKISAKSPESLQGLLTAYEELLNSKSTSTDVSFADLAYSANIGRSDFNHRALIIANDFEQATKVIHDKSFKQAEVHSSVGHLCFLFTGQGSQYPNMAANLYNTSPIFRDHFDKCDQILSRQYSINLRQVLWGKSSDDKELSRTLYSQTSIFCIEYCLLKLWESWGVKPDYVMGHSLGEFAAAVAVGALDFEDALMLVAERSRLIDNLQRGKMLVIKADKQEVAQNIEKFKQIKSDFWVDYAALNSSDQTVVAGDSGMIEEFAKFCGENSLKTITLASTHAFHSRHMDDMLETYRKVANSVKLPTMVDENAPKYISGMEGKIIDLEHMDADYWVRHTREPVNFIDACKTVQSEGCSLFLELGPHPVLSALTMTNIEGQSVTCLPSIRKKEDEWTTILDSLAKLYLADWKGQIDWKGYDRYYNRSRMTLPFYPFNRKPVWRELEAGLPTVHPLLGKLIPTASGTTIFENKITIKNTPFTQDHVIGSTVVFPGAAFLEMCLTGGHATVEGSLSTLSLPKPRRPILLKSLNITSPLALHDSGHCRLQTVTKLNDKDPDDICYSVGVHRHVAPTGGSGGDWISHAGAQFFPIGPTKSAFSPIDIPEIQNSWEKTDNSGFYERLPEVGLRFGPKFQSLEMGWKSEKGMLMGVKMPDEDYEKYLIHPVVADAMIQAIMVWTNRDKTVKTSKMKLQVPVQIGEFIWFCSSASDSANRYVYCGLGEDGRTHCILVDDSGTLLAQMSGVEFIETTVKLIEGMIQQQSTAMPKLWKEVWKSAPGALQFSYDLTMTGHVPLLQMSEEEAQSIADANDVGEEEANFHENVCNLSRLYFLDAMYQLGWKPNNGTKFNLEELVKLLPTPKEHFRRYIRFFLYLLAEAGILTAEAGAEDTYKFAGLPPTQDEIATGLKKVTSPKDTSRVEHQMVVRAGSNLSQVFLGKVEPLQLLFPEDPSKVNAGDFYKAIASFILPIGKTVNANVVTPVTDVGQKAYLELHKGSSTLPTFRVLEIGSGTGVFTKQYLEDLEASGKPYEFYFTDISASFFNGAEKEFEKYKKNMVFKKLDMEEDPLAQGFCPQYFDMIMACEVVHASTDIRKTLRNLKVVLKPGAIFQIIETTQPDPKITQIFGLLEGYWQFKDLDLRPYHTTLTPEKWKMVFREIGCDRVECTPAYHNKHGFISARLSVKENEATCVSLPVPPVKTRFSWLIFYNDSSQAICDLLKQKLVGVNRKVTIVKRPPACTEESMKALMKTQLDLAAEDVERVEGIVFMWGLADDLSNRDQRQISLPMISLVQEIAEYKVPPRLYVVTHGTAAVEGSEVINPTAGTLHGIIRSLSNEIVGLYVSILDLSPEESQLAQVNEIFYDFWTIGKGNRCIAFRNDKRLCPNLVSAKVNYNELLPLSSGSQRFQLLLPSTRMISDLEFIALENYTLEENEVEVQVKAMALNFRDVFTVLKPTEQFEELNTVGLDFAGVIVKVGSNVKDRKIGDRVIGMNMTNNLSLPSHIKMEEQLVIPFPESFTHTEAVTLPAVFATAVYCLNKVAKMKKGETILIHTASGGVGLCAIQLAQRIGTNIIATAGSKRKRNYLRNMGIKHVFHSRTTDFGKQILEVTNGRGVDIVLNSITGEGFKEASLGALAKNGRFIEMSKLNVWQPEVVKELRPDVFYEIVDLTSLERPELQNLIDLLKEYIDAASVKPIAYERFDALNIRGALNYLQKARHIGKIVCVMPEVKIENSKIITTTPLFNDLSTYLVTGGLGGIGFEAVKWMLSSGAKHIAIASRNPPKPEIAIQIESWNKDGKHVEAFAIDIGDPHQCQKLFQELKSPSRGFPQLRGVMHVAGVISDAIMENQTWEKFHQTYKPKVDGTWNLHDLTKGMLLEHFVVFSSMAASFGSPAQSNHAASNSFEDSLVAYRRSMGLPATTVNWGNWGEVGVATEVDFPGIRPITTSQGMMALETFLKTQTSYMSVVNVDSFALAGKLFPNLKSYVDDKRLFGDMHGAVSLNSDEFWKAVDACEEREGKVAVFKQFIKSTLRNILKMDKDEAIDDFAEFQSLGVDSLMMIEIKNGLQNILGSRMTLSASQLKDCNNTETLANRLVDILLGDEDQSQVNLPTMEELQKLVRQDSILPEHIRPSEGSLKKDVAQIESVLIFGATGSLGPYILRELSHRPAIRRIYCVIRKTGSSSPSDKLLKRLQAIKLDGQVDMTKVECLQGDLTDDKFGLSEEDYTRLAEDADAIINSAGRSDHTAKYYDAPEKKKLHVRNVNVKGSTRILEFAVHSKLKHVYHASTLLGLTTTDKTGHLSEDWQDVGVFDQLPFNAGYPLSKHISEQLCREAVERGIPCKTFRLPMIGGDRKTGRTDYLNNHVVLRWLAYLKLKCMPYVPTPMVVLSVDDCAKISLDVFFHPAAPYDVYNVMHKDGGLDQTLIGVAEDLGITIKPISFSQFVEKLKEEKDDSPFAAFRKMYEDEEALLVHNFEGGNPALQEPLQKYAEDSGTFYRSRKLAQLITNYDELESTEAVMRRDVGYLKESGVFEMFGIE